MNPDMASMANAVEANLFAFFRQLSNWPLVEVHDDADCFWTISDLPFPLFNSVMRAQAPARAEALIDARIAACEARRVPMLWWTGPSTQPDDLGDALAERGFLFEPSHGMAADLDDVDADYSQVVSAAPQNDARNDIAIEPVRDIATLHAWSRVLCDAFGAPRAFGDAFAELAGVIGLGDESPFRHFLARLDGEPVATSSLFLGAGVAGLYDVATVAEKRRRGIAREVTRAAMRDARASGHRTAILHSSGLGAGMYRSLGFRDVCDIGQYVWVPENLKR